MPRPAVCCWRLPAWRLGTCTARPSIAPGTPKPKPKLKPNVYAYRRAYSMSVIERTPSTGGRFWPGWLLIVLCLSSASALTGCSTSYAVAPRLPAPNPELMEPEKTGSEYSASVSQHMKTWAEKLDGWLTK